MFTKQGWCAPNLGWGGAHFCCRADQGDAAGDWVIDGLYHLSGSGVGIGQRCGNVIDWAAWHFRRGE